MNGLEKEVTNYMLDNIKAGTPKSIGETIKFFIRRGYEEKDIHNAIKLFSSKHIDCNPEEYDA